MFDPVSMLAIFGPVAVDAGKALINRFVASESFKPATIDEYVKVKTLDGQLFKAMNEIGSGSVSYPWVEAIIKLQRPAFAGVTLLIWSYAHTAPGYSLEQLQSIDTFAAAVGFYLFGDRTLFHSREQGKKK